jgi:hypothetical protein
VFARDVSRVTPSTIGDIEKVFDPVPALVVNADDRLVIPCVVVIEMFADTPEGCVLLAVGELTLVTVLEKLDESVNLASELTAPSASRVFESTVEKNPGVKLAAVREVPEYLGVLEIVKFAILPPNILKPVVLHSEATQRFPVDGRFAEVTATPVTAAFCATPSL